MKFCEYCGKEVDNEIEICPQCEGSLIEDNSSTNSKKNDSSTSITTYVTVACCVGLLIICAMFLFTSPDQNTNYNNTSYDNISYNNTNYNNDFNLSEDDYKDNCSVISFKKLDKNSIKYYGQSVKFTGKVLEIQEDNDEGCIRLATDGDYGDVIFISYTGTNDILEGEKITVYGDIMGDYTYTSQANYEITLPWIYARYFE